MTKSSRLGKSGYRFARLLIVGTEADVESGQYRSRILPKAVLHTLFAFEARYVPVVWEPTPDRAAARIERWAVWFARELVKSCSALVVNSRTADRQSDAAG